MFDILSKEHQKALEGWVLIDGMLKAQKNHTLKQVYDRLDTCCTWKHINDMRQELLKEIE